jgi:hypothetical protein
VTVKNSFFNNAKILDLVWRGAKQMRSITMMRSGSDAMLLILQIDF